jgi:hypothetical protein
MTGKSKKVVEIGRLCPVCKTKFIRFFYEAFCTRSGRGANSLCKNHIDKLICSDCAVKMESKKKVRAKRKYHLVKSGDVVMVNGTEFKVTKVTQGQPYSLAKLDRKLKEEGK